MAKLSLKNVSMIYVTEAAATPAVKDISIDVAEGEFVSLIGPSGCGKTTILSLIAGLLSPTRGTILLDDEALQPQNGQTGYMLQQDYLFPWLTIEDNITLGQSIRGFAPERKKEAMELLKKMELDDKRSYYPNQLSGGMRQRVALVRMLATNPTLMLLDEPFSALDYQTKLKLENLMFSTLKAEKKTAVLVTHDIGEAIAMSDRVFLLSQRPGQIQQIFAVPDEIRRSLPFEARQLPAYNEQFSMIWEELEKLEAPATS